MHHLAMVDVRGRLGWAKAAAKSAPLGGGDRRSPRRTCATLIILRRSATLQSRHARISASLEFLTTA